MTPNEIMELQQKAQFKYARYYHTSAVRRRKIRDQKIQSTIAQTKAIAELLESAPKLSEYDEVMNIFNPMLVFFQNALNSQYLK